MNAHDVMTAAIERVRRERSNRSSARLAGAAWEALDKNGYAIVERGELEATKALLAETKRQCASAIADYCALRDAMPLSQVQHILGSSGGRANG